MQWLGLGETEEFPLFPTVLYFELHLILQSFFFFSTEQLLEPLREISMGIYSAIFAVGGNADQWAKYSRM